MSLFHSEPSLLESLGVWLPALTSVLVISIPLLLAGGIYRAQKAADRSQEILSKKELLFEQLLEELDQYSTDQVLGNKNTVPQLSSLVLLLHKIALYAENDDVIRTSRAAFDAHTDDKKTDNIWVVRRAMLLAMRLELHPKSKIDASAFDMRKSD